MIFESTPHFFNCHMWMFPFWKHLIAFFRNKRWKVIGFTEGSIFSNVAHTYFYRSFVVFKQRTTFFFLLSKLIILQKQRFSFLWKNRNIVLFVNSLQKRKAQESINKVSVELLITTPSATNGSLPFNQAELYELHLPSDGDLLLQ